PARRRACASAGAAAGRARADGARDGHSLGHRQGIHLWRARRAAGNLQADGAGAHQEHLSQAAGPQPVRGRVRGFAPRPDPAVMAEARPSWLARLGWTALAIATIAIALSAFWIDLRPPRDALAIDRATYTQGDGPPEQVMLPHTVSRFSTLPAAA